MQQARAASSVASSSASGFGSSVVAGDDKSEVGTAVSTLASEESSVDLPPRSTVASDLDKETPDMSPDASEAGAIYYHAPGFYYT